MSKRGPSLRSGNVSTTTSEQVLTELKAMRSELSGQIKELSADLKAFQHETQQKLDAINVKILAIDKEFEDFKESLNANESLLEDLKKNFQHSAIQFDELHQQNREMQEKLEQLERYSRDYNIRLTGIEEKEGEECISIVQDCLQKLNLRNEFEVENAHRTGKPRPEKPRQLIAKLYSRPFKRQVLATAKSKEGKVILGDTRIVEDFTPNDLKRRIKALPIMKAAYDKGGKVRFTKGRLFIDGKEIPVD